MKKLYAIRNKKTGEYYMEPDRIIPDKDEVFAATTKEWAVFIRRLEDMKDTHEIISFCIEPTEPCEWCICVYSITPIKHKQPLPVADFGAHFCPNCGRSLK